MTHEETTRVMDDLVYRVNSLEAEERDKVIAHIERTLRQLQKSNGDIMDGFIYKTVDFNQFHDMQGNRLIDEESVKIRRLAQSLKNFGNISPIIVNGKYETVDGQRRLIAASTNEDKIPIRYTVLDNADIVTVSEVNKFHIPWDVKDWEHKHIEDKNQHYITYQKIEEKYGKIIKSRALRSWLMYGKIGPFKREIWESGGFVIDTESLKPRMDFLKFLTEIKAIGGKENVFAANRDFQHALSRIWNETPGFDKERMISKIRSGYDRLNIKTHSKQYHLILVKLYNSNISAKSEISKITPPEINSEE